MNHLETGSPVWLPAVLSSLGKLRSAETKFACFSGWKDTET
ncbi:hypothetical protein WYY_17921 [Bacillus velezensis M27]|nr:hypothetical protein KSO_017685 [Bacillus amyloliquefaciens IT-45]AHC40951.1 hypothetical protein U722_02035 [Bacillus amyloliquefaciens LFB112]EKE46339.1 hypothetical protein WYY_17921 [Bacillus velezensis M27]ERK82048.1 hypothetical protein N786_16140 [Bacillus amyloliquefaciens UASWS BA1]RAP16618.1 hypothetical protein C2W63_03523 [Bacillus velezensis]